MKHTIITLAAVLVVGYGVSVAAQAKPKATAPRRTGTTDQVKIQEALSAGPADIRKGAMVMDFPAAPGGPMKMLRNGTNGWICMPSAPRPNPSAPGVDPMCFDKTFNAWGEALMAKKDPPAATSVGVAYMLRGDRGASNKDPNATAPTPDNEWVVSPAHVMMIVPSTSQLDAFPTDPHNGGPWVMWKGTKYAHLMVPIAAMPKAAAPK